MDLTEGLVTFGIFALFNVLAYWKRKPSAILFLLLAGISLMFGLAWFDVYTNTLGLSVGTILIAYMAFCIGYAIKVTFWKEKGGENGD